jgi:GT2 family glycosyltransferase
LTRILITEAAPATAEHALHRARHLVALCQGRAVHLAGATDTASRQVIEAAATLVESSAEIVLSLAAQPAADILAGLSGLIARCDAAGLVILTETPADAAGTGDPALRTALRQRFRHVATLVQRPFTASAIAPEPQAALRILPLAAPPRMPPLCLIHLCADTPPPLPAAALHERGATGWIAPPLVSEAAPAQAWGLPPAGLPAPLAELRARAVTLVERLERQSDLVRRQAARIAALERGGGAVPATGTPATGAPEPRHGWPLAETPGADPAGLSAHDHRPDDPVILEGRIGAAFLERFALRGAIPDIAGAIAALNALRRPAPVSPEVSVVLPVHGRLPATLNCLHSLFRLPDETSFEIIVIDDASPDGSARHLAELHGLRLLREADQSGFAASCNRAAGHAIGDFVLLLDNATRVVPGWLDALVDSFTLFPRAGLVGSKLFHPDGRLQQAGGILWRDGSAWDDGRDDDPNRPCHCFARQVDHVSRRSMMLPTALWRRLGGFDPRFAPASGEDADLALRVRAAGHEVWFQPLSRVAHDEGDACAAAAAKAGQALDARTLFLRWRDTLATHRPPGAAPWRERERHVHRRTLVIDAAAPTSRTESVLLTLQLFQRLGYKVHHVRQHNLLYQPEPLAPLQREGVEVAYAPYDRDVTGYINRCGALFDVVMVLGANVPAQVIAALRQHAPLAPVLVQLDDAGSTAARMMQDRELGLIGQADVILTRSTRESALLAELAPTAPVLVWPVMVALQGTAVGASPRRDLCFLGGGSDAPTVDAAVFMVEQVMPLIWRQEPACRCIIAGADPGPTVRALAGARVIVTGQPVEPRALFDTSRVCVCPLRAGAGTAGGIATAMAHGVPVVSTACGAEGMDLTDGEEVLIADTPDTFAAACLLVYRDADLWHRLSEAGQRAVQERHAPAMGERVLAEAIEAGLRHRLGLPLATADRHTGQDRHDGLR